MLKFITPKRSLFGGATVHSVSPCHTPRAYRQSSFGYGVRFRISFMNLSRHPLDGMLDDHAMTPSTDDKKRRGSFRRLRKCKAHWSSHFDSGKILIPSGLWECMNAVKTSLRQET
jgi:hypothetical protein